MKKFIIIPCIILLLIIAASAFADERIATSYEQWQERRDGVVYSDHAKTTKIIIPECEVSKKEFDAFKRKVYAELYGKKDKKGEVIQEGLTQRMTAVEKRTAENERLGKANEEKIRYILGWLSEFKEKSFDRLLKKVNGLEDWIDRTESWMWFLAIVLSLLIAFFGTALFFHKEGIEINIKKAAVKKKRVVKRKTVVAEEAAK